MHLHKAIILVVLSPFLAAAKSDVAALTAEFLKKPHVLPSAERAYHAVYHELDNIRKGGSDEPVFGQLYVALIEDEFTFGGDMNTWPASKFKGNNKACKPFMANNVHHFCEDNFFLVHQDMVKLQKTAFGGGATDPDFKTVCSGRGFRPGDDPVNNFVYRYKHRVLMTYKKSVNDNKCIGTYDSKTDTFTCMYNDPSKGADHPLVPLAVKHFLWKQDTGTFARGVGNVEVFCKEMHYVK